MPSHIAAQAKPKLTIRQLLYKRMKLSKYTAFGTFYKCRCEDFRLANEGSRVMDYNFSSIAEKWKALSKEEQQPFYDVMAMSNALVDEKKKAIDKEIISLRPGKRQYSGYTISRRISQKDKQDIDKRAFNPVFWYQCQKHRQEARDKSKRRRWVGNYRAFVAESHSEWPTLTPTQQRQFIHQAKVEFHNYNHRSSFGDGVVYAVLARSLAKHAEAASRTRLDNEFLSDDDEEDDDDRKKK